MALPVHARAVATLSVGLALAGCDGATPAADVIAAPLASSTATDGWAVNYPKQRKVLFMSNRLWLFYSDGRDALVRTTADGTDLTDPFLVRADAVFGHRCGYAFDGTFLHYACSTAVDGADVHYRRGLPREDGTIDWTAPEQVAFDVAPGHGAMYPKVVVDAAGRAWVAFMLYQGGAMTAPQDAVVTRSDAADGTWLTKSAGFPFTLVGGSVETYPDPLGVALAGGGVYWLYDLDGRDEYRGREWKNDAWGSEERISLAPYRDALFDAVAEGDAVHAVYGTGTIRYRHRDESGVWSDEIVVSRFSASHMSVTLADPGRVLVTWLDRDDDRIVQREVSAGGVLGPRLELLDAGALGLAGPDLGINLNGLDRAAGPFLSAVTATLGTEPPYAVWLAARLR